MTEDAEPIYPHTTQSMRTKIRTFNLALIRQQVSFHRLNLGS
ncbi:hypothetical protein Dcar01_03046 [Deinococcus carri]|uniref:Transposase n=1 Tax=Deinococcus carri TaxID=1211323 RepID=A0ABP9WAB5_9DEIO